MRALPIAVVVAFGLGCFGRGAYPCRDDTQCDRAALGICEDSGFCSYPNAECESRRSYDALAGDGLAGQCVDAAADDGSGGATTTPSTGSGDDGCAPICEDHDADGYGDGDGCMGLDCDDANPARFDGCKYVAPGGDDAADGSRDAPWGTLGHAVAQLVPGDSLVLLDGEYTSSTTGLLFVDCSDGGNAASGLSAQSPISIRAENDRAARLVSDGSEQAITLRECGYWNVTGLAARGGDVPSDTQVVASFGDSHDLRLRRLLASHSNRYSNSIALFIGSCQEVVLEDSEVYAFHRTGLHVYQSSDVSVRRCYVNARDWADLPGAASDEDPATPYASSYPSTGDTGIAVDGERNRIENCIVEGNVGIAYTLGGGAQNTVSGSIAIDPTIAFHAGAEYGGASVDNRFENVVAIRSTSNAMYLRTASSVAVDGLTVLASAANGLVGDEQSDDPCANYGGCAFDARHVLALDNAADGIRGDPPVTWSVSWSNAAGSGGLDFGVDEPIEDGEGIVQNSISESVPEIGVAAGRCMAFVPEGSAMKGRGGDGADIGANVLYVYEDGALTTTPLWDPVTGAFPCGAVVPGINDDPATSCAGVHEALNFGAGGCALPSGYGDDASCP